MSGPPRPTLFPYTTLFRSGGGVSFCPLSVGGRLTLASVGSGTPWASQPRSEEHTSELQSRFDLVCRLQLEKNSQEVQLPIRGRARELVGEGLGRVRRPDAE